MIVIQFTGLSGAGKTTLAENAAKQLQTLNHKVEIIDGDIYRQMLCQDLGFSKEDRYESIKRLYFVAKTLVKFDVIVLLAIINPYEALRQQIRQDADVRTVYINCPLQELIARDPKGLYKKALLPEDDPHKIKNFTGISDTYEIPTNPDLIIYTDKENIQDSANRLVQFILKNVAEHNALS